MNFDYFLWCASQFPSSHDTYIKKAGKINLLGEYISVTPEIFVKSTTRNDLKLSGVQILSCTQTEIQTSAMEEAHIVLWFSRLLKLLTNKLNFRRSGKILRYLLFISENSSVLQE